MRCSSPHPGGVFSSLRAGQTLPSPQTCVRTRSVLCNICAQATPLPFPRMSSHSSMMDARAGQGQVLGFVCTSSGLPHWHSLACSSPGVTKPNRDLHHHSSISMVPKPPCPCLSPRHTHVGMPGRHEGENRRENCSG